MRLSFTLMTASLALSASSGCSSPAASGRSPGGQCQIQVDRFKELTIVDPAVISDARSLNAQDGPWSFRHAMESLMPAQADPSTFILSWLDNWLSTTEINGFSTDLESRAEGMNQYLTCPWLQQTAANQCDATCGTCVARTLDMARAPFRLIAIVNRIDQRERPDAPTPSGEARLLFALTNGAADDGPVASPPLAMTMIFEYGLPASLSPSQWAGAFHHLGTHSAFDDSYKAELEGISERFVAAGTSPLLPNGSSIARVRTNESAFNWIWQLRQFTLDLSGQLRLSTLPNTPGSPLNDSAILAAYVSSNIGAINGNTDIMPAAFLAGSVNSLLFRWEVPGVDETTRGAFAKHTCNGCHTGENPPIDVAFHVSPLRDGIAKLSPFLNNPSDSAHDELGRREAYLSTVLCTQ